MQILTETPTEDGQYVMLWAGGGALWCNQVRIVDGTMSRRISTLESAFDEDNWVRYSTEATTAYPKTFLKL